MEENASVARLPPRLAPARASAASPEHQGARRAAQECNARTVWHIDNSAEKLRNHGARLSSRRTRAAGRARMLCPVLRRERAARPAQRAEAPTTSSPDIYWSPL